MSWIQRAGSRRTVTGVLIAAALVALVALTSCQKKTEQTATPPAGTPAAGVAGAAQPIDLHWDATGNCLSYTPPVDSVMAGGTINFNSSVTQDVTVIAPAGCFAAGPDTFVVAKGGTGVQKTAYSAGSYRLVYNPAACATPTGGNGPNVIINSGR